MGQQAEMSVCITAGNLLNTSVAIIDLEKCPFHEKSELIPVIIQRYLFGHSPTKKLMAIYVAK
jgi:hypothetical protein